MLTLIILFTFALGVVSLGYYVYRWQFGSKQKPKINNGSEFTAAKHVFVKLQSSGMVHTCNVCSQLIAGIFSSSARECQICGLKMHATCALRHKPRCKRIITSEQSHKHQWLQHQTQNVPCSVCFLSCSSIFSATQTCLWCHRTIHSDCQKDLTPKDESCDCGDLAKSIILPTEVSYQTPKPKKDSTPTTSYSFMKRKSKQPFWKSLVPTFNRRKGSASNSAEVTQMQQQKKTLANSSDDTETETEYLKSKEVSPWIFQINADKSPIIVVINKKSGGQMGQQYLAQLFRLLNPIQVIDLLEDGLVKLKIFSSIPNIRIVVGGGDGTVASVVNYVKSGAIPNWIYKNPPVSVLPLGTGNDLGRCLGWGGGSEGAEYVETYLQSVAQNSQPMLLDRWNLQSTKECLYNQSEFKIYNYFSIGLDARTCLNFHRLREKMPQLFFSRIVNKFIYSQIGAADIFAGKKLSLSEECEVYVDGNRLHFPKNIQNIVFLNITSWAGGATRIWELSKHENENNAKEFFLEDEAAANSNESNQKSMKTFKAQSLMDKKLEVIGLTSVLHLGRVQTGIDRPIKLAQGSKIKVKILASSSTQAMQIDGEPFEVAGPIEFEINHSDQVNMLTHRNQKQLQPEAKMLKALAWAQENNHITQQQKDLILSQFLLQE